MLIYHHRSCNALICRVFVTRRFAFFTAVYTGRHHDLISVGLKVCFIGKSWTTSIAAASRNSQKWLSDLSLSLCVYVCVWSCHTLVRVDREKLWSWVKIMQRVRATKRWELIHFSITTARVREDLRSCVSWRLFRPWHEASASPRLTFTVLWTIRPTFTQKASAVSVLRFKLNRQTL